MTVIIPATLMSIDGIDFEDWAVRGIKMSLQPIDNGELVRDCNGNLRDITIDSHRKYAISISCTDQDAPILTNVWRGKQIELSCIPGLGVDNNTGGTLTINALVTGWTTNRDEYGASTDWQLDAEQI